MSNTKQQEVYKIRVDEYGDNEYRVMLLKKWWIFWRKVESKFVKAERVIKLTEFAIKNIVREWQSQYNVPDEMVIIQD